MKKDSVFITGATGFIGSYVVRYLLDKGYKVIALKRATTSMDLLGEAEQKVEWVNHSIFDIKDVENIISAVDIVIHCAGKISNDKRDLDEMMRTNVEATQMLVDLSLANSVKKFVHISSVAAIGRNKIEQELNENSPWTESESNSDYAYSKMLAEHEVWRGYHEGLNTIIINPSFVLGAGHWHKGTSSLINQLFKLSKYYPTGSNGFVDVRDVAQICIKALESDYSGERYIVNGVNLKYKELFSKISAALNVEKPSEALESFKAGLAWRMDKIRSVLFSRERILTKAFIKRLSSKVSYNNEKSKLAFDHEYIDVNTTIEETATAYLKAIESGKTYSRFALFNSKNENLKF